MNPNHENFLSLKLWTTPSDWVGKPWKGWYVGLMKTRDSGALDRSNFDCFLEAVQKASAGKVVDDSANAYMDDWSETETVYVVHEGHWACGWIEWVAIDESDEAACEVAEEILNNLADYPVVDEEHWSETESEDEYQAWDSWLRHSLINTLSDEHDGDEPEDYPTLREWADEQEHSVLWEAYRSAMEATNTYPYHGDDGCSVDVDRISHMFEEYLHQLRVNEPRLELQAAGQMTLPLEVTE